MTKTNKNNSTNAKVGRTWSNQIYSEHQSNLLGTYNKDMTDQHIETTEN